MLGCDWKALPQETIELRRISIVFCRFLQFQRVTIVLHNAYQYYLHYNYFVLLSIMIVVTSSYEVYAVIVQL